MPKVSVIIPAWNAKGLLKLCLESIFKQSFKDFEIIVVDNGSNDGTQKFIQRFFPQVNLVSNRENRGACFARNKGIKQAKGDLIVTLDSDVILAEDFLEEMVNSLNRKEQKVGMLGAKVYKEKRIIDTAGIMLTEIRRFYDRGRGQNDRGQFDRKLDIFGPSAVAALYKKEMLEELKIKNEYFDNEFSFLVEDVDLAWRAQKFDWKSKFVPRAVCFHRGNSSKTNKKMRQYLCFRNRYYSILKNENFLRLLIFFIPALICYELPRFFYLLLTNPYISTIFRNIKKDFKSMMEKRKIIRQKA